MSDMNNLNNLGTSLEFVQINPEALDLQVLQALDHATAKRFSAIPVAINGPQVTIALGDVSDTLLLDDLRMYLAPRTIKFVTADPGLIEASLRWWALSLAHTTELAVVAELYSTISTDVHDETYNIDNSVNKLVDNMLSQAVTAGASDVHIEPTDEGVVIRFRIDGVLVHHTSLPLEHADSIVNSVKTMAYTPGTTNYMSIINRLHPEDGVFTRELANHIIDCRVVTIPLASGLQSTVIRLLDRSRVQLALGEIGFHKEIESKFLDMLQISYGMILVTGPTGSGKTTTLYGALSQAARPDRKVWTIEDPVEISFSAISQVQVNTKTDLTFASALKSFLRADPDVILVGEIRDQETAELAARAALTGHLVLSTLHTNDAAGAPARLMNMGLEEFTVSSALKAVLSQRLLRRLCENCATEVPLSSEVAIAMGFEASNLEVPTHVKQASANGCKLCNNRGYKGRVVASELLVVKDNVALANAIAGRATSLEIERISRETNPHSIHRDALLWLSEQVTSVEEIRRAGI
jgi:type II secretory ATPase GspE/PulE/Tfp pilus assembly ATPase PilB-like protein